MGLLPGHGLPGARSTVLASALCSTAKYFPACRAPVAPWSPSAPHRRAAGGFILGPCRACPGWCTSPVGWRSLAHGCAPRRQHPGAAPAHDSVCLWHAVGVHNSRCVPSVGPRARRRDSVTSRRNAVTSPCCASVGQAEVSQSPPPPRAQSKGLSPAQGPPPCVTDWSGAGPGAALPCDPTCLAAQPVHAPHPPAARAPHTHRYGGISLPRVPPRGTGAVISPVGLETGQPSTHRTSCDAQGGATSVVPEVRMRP